MAAMKNVIRLFVLISALLCYVPRIACQGVPDFTLSVSGNPQVIWPGQTAQYTIRLTPLNGFASTDNVFLSIDPAPGSYYFLPSFVAAGASGTFLLEVTPSAIPAKYTFQLIAGGPATTHSAQLMLEAAAGGAFSESVLPDTVSISRGESAVFTINMMPLGVFTGDVSLTVSGLPPDTSARFNPTVINASNPTSTLTITSSDRVDDDHSHEPDKGTYTLTVGATSGSLTHLRQVTLSLENSKGTRVVRRISFLDLSPAASLSPTTLFVPEEDGFYRVNGYMVATAADETAFQRLSITGGFTWTDQIGTRFFQPPSVFGMGGDAWILPLSGNQYQLSTTSFVLDAKALRPVLFQADSYNTLHQETLARYSVYFVIEKL